VDLKANTVSIIQKPIVTGRPTCAERILTNRLLAGGAHIHVDFHAAGHFDDLGGFPGHLGSPCSRIRTYPPGVKLLRAQKFASEIFPSEPYCAAKSAWGTVLSGDMALRWAHSVANAVLIKQL
jgi:hypothetical protein